MANRVIDDRAGFKVYAKDCKYEWTGALVRKEDWETAATARLCARGA